MNKLKNENTIQSSSKEKSQTQTYALTNEFVEQKMESWPDWKRDLCTNHYGSGIYSKLIVK